MREQSKKKEKSYEYSYCKVCRINHDQGRRHNYFPSHVASLSSFLSRFRAKLIDVRFFLSNPISLLPQHTHLNRLWCVFCDLDVLELDSSFACDNAINHLAGAEHLKNLKSFLWKFGGKMDQVDTFRVSEEDLAKWEKKCKSLISSAASEESGGNLIGPSNDIHHELNSECVDNNEKNINHFVKSSFPNCVMPLQYHTNERYQVCNSEPSEVSGIGPPCNVVTSYFPVETRFKENLCSSNGSTGNMVTLQSLASNEGIWAGHDYISNGAAQADTRMVDRGSSSQGFHNLAQISSVVEANHCNIHTGAPPPWFDSSKKSLMDVRPKLEIRSRNISSPKKSGKIQRLNPNRVGAAWAEKRKIELEMEKRGEIVANNFDNNWLPNFGSVWQSGTRKESKKEFVAENKDPLKTVPQSEKLVEIQPYVSKRKRKDTGDKA